MDKAIQKIKQRFGIIGNSKLLNHAIEVAMQVAPTDMTVFINGESGSGKESFSKIIHSLSKYKHGKFIAINCGAIPEGTIDSELFGHEKGAFTGAEGIRKGYFEEVNNGTIFLDEIGEMPKSTQSRLLRVLEQGEYIRVGSSKVQKTNVRVITATNIDLKESIKKREFREDLYYRLNTVPIYVPPLRERQEDIDLLFRKFASDFSNKYNIDPIRLSEEALSALQKYSFPGNIRELKNIVDRMSILEKIRNIDYETLSQYLPKEVKAQYPILSTASDSNDFQAQTEKEMLFKAMLEMKNEIDKLKTIILEILKNNNITIKNSLFEELESLNTRNLGFTEKIPNLISLIQPNFNPKIDSKVIETVDQDENLSIEKKEEELVKKALIKYNHRRGLAAKELGISERTLYRKIKQYKLDQ